MEGAKSATEQMTLCATFIPWLSASALLGSLAAGAGHFLASFFGSDGGDESSGGYGRSRKAQIMYRLLESGNAENLCDGERYM